MKTIGLLGGMSWESTASYYRIINEGMRERLGGLHSGRIILYSVEFGEVEARMAAGDWDAVLAVLVESARKVETAGADFILVCTNTMHKLVPAVQESISIPILHIGDTAAEVLAVDGVRCAGLLGTLPTMQEDFCRERFERRGIRVVIFGRTDMEFVHRAIFSELCAGIFKDESRERFREIISGMAAEGAEGIVLGCTEIPLLLRPEHSELPLYDTTEIHALAAVGKALA